MKIYLLPSKKDKYILYSNEFQVEKHKESNSQKPESRFWNSLKSGYKTATAKRERSERLLKEMSMLAYIVVYYPGNLSEEGAQEIYHQIVQSQIKKHKRWLIVDGALLPLSMIFTLVPGPNVLMAYLAWRTLMHYKTKKSGEKAASHLEISFVEEPHLERLFEITNSRLVYKRRVKINAIGEKIGIANLDKIT